MTFKMGVIIVREGIGCRRNERYPYLKKVDRSRDDTKRHVKSVPTDINGFIRAVRINWIITRTSVVLQIGLCKNLCQRITKRRDPKSDTGKYFVAEICAI